jgi:hypothetical protein
VFESAQQDVGGEVSRMKILLVTVGLMALAACTLASNRPRQAAATAIKADALGIKVDMPPLEVRDAKNGDEGYTCFVMEIAGRLYVEKIDDLKATPGMCRIHIKRVPAGVLLEPNSNMVALHREGDESNMNWYLPVLGILKSSK